jgi:hypothetical protein
MDAGGYATVLPGFGEHCKKLMTRRKLGQPNAVLFDPADRSNRGDRDDATRLEDYMRLKEPWRYNE